MHVFCGEDVFKDSDVRKYRFTPLAEAPCRTHHLHLYF